MASPRFKQIDGVWFRVFTDDRGRARKIKATAAELRREGIEQDAPAAAGDEGAAAAPASSSAAAERDAAEEKAAASGSEATSGSDAASSTSTLVLVAGVVLTLAATLTVGWMWLHLPGKRGDELEPGTTGEDLVDDAPGLRLVEG